MHCRKRSGLNRQQKRDANNDVGVQVCAYTENIHTVSIRRIVSAAVVRGYGHVVHDDGRNDAAARKHEEPIPAKQSIALSLNVPAQDCYKNTMQERD